MTLAPPDPWPVSEALEQHLRDVLTQIPSGRRATLTAAVTRAGAEAGAGVRHDFGRWELSGSGWVGREWGPGKAWAAGARVGVAF